MASWRMWTGSKLRVRNHGWSGMEAVPGEEPWAWRDCRVVHAVVSIPDTGQGIEESRSQARAIAKKHNLDGGLMVYHPFDKEGFIKYHVLALAHGDILPGGTDENVIFKIVKDAENQDYRGFVGPAGIRRALHYLLSHAGIIQGRHALTWWGSLAYRNFPDRILKESYPEAWEDVHDTRARCPFCGSRNTERDETPQDFGWPSKRPIHHSPFVGIPWGT